MPAASFQKFKPRPLKGSLVGTATTLERRIAEYPFLHGYRFDA